LSRRSEAKADFDSDHDHDSERENKTDFGAETDDFFARSFASGTATMA
jgi:hypothetical protein